MATDKPRLCLCRCGREVHGKKNKKYATGACSKRLWDKRLKRRLFAYQRGGVRVLIPGMADPYTCGNAEHETNLKEKAYPRGTVYWLDGQEMRV